MTLDEIVLRARDDRRGLDVDYRPAGTTACLLGRTSDDALRAVRYWHGFSGMAHQIALARALGRGAHSEAREAAWEIVLLAEDIAAEVTRFQPELAAGTRVNELAQPVLEATDALLRELGIEDGPRAALAPHPAGCEQAVSRLADTFTAFVAGLHAMMPPRLHPLLPEARAVVEAASGAPEELLARLHGELPRRLRALGSEPALPAVVEADGMGTALTSSGRITYGVRVAAGCVSRIACSTPTDRLFKPGGAAVRLLDSFDGDRTALAMLMASLDPEVAWELVGAGADA